MQSTRHLPIDIDEVAEAMDVTQRDIIDFYLDTQTGAVVTIGDGMDECIDVEDDERYEHIPERATFESYDVMRQFIGTVADDAFAVRLSSAITGSGAFGRFKRTIAERADEQARWYRFRDAALRQDAIDWLESIHLQSTKADAKDGRSDPKSD